jgi:hypothetical protein
MRAAEGDSRRKSLWEAMLHACSGDKASADMRLLEELSCDPPQRTRSAVSVFNAGLPDTKPQKAFTGGVRGNWSWKPPKRRRSRKAAMS